MGSSWISVGTGFCRDNGVGGLVAISGIDDETIKKAFI